MTPMLEYSIPIAHIADVVQQLRAKGKNAAFAVLMFDPPSSLPGSIGSTNLQYSVENDSIGLDWILIGPRNIADKQALAEFMMDQGYEVVEREMNGVNYLRVEGHGIADLGTLIVTNFYQLQPQMEVGLLTADFDYEPIHDCTRGLELVRQAGAQPRFAAEVERVAAVLRLMAGKTTSNYGEGTVAWVELRTEAGFIGFTDVVDDNDSHRLFSEVSSGQLIREIEKGLTENFGMDLIPACGFGRPYQNGSNARWFVTDYSDEWFNGLAEFSVGIMFLLFGQRLEDPVQVDFFVPGPDLDKLPNWDELPEAFQVPYCDFNSRIYAAIAKYHKLMASDDGEPFDPKIGNPNDVCDEMQTVLKDYPAFVGKLGELGAPYAYFLSYALDNQTELSESLNTLRRRYRAQMFN
ncbi:MAG: hypothetical protein A3G80_02465 [Betaproteobacteria bacterium RIFCSPLOWO2_12_FULL_62_13b]|nr:MAG: hypothetical protein A3G80_02465 [Betaproteobacteria bacterium RIFCSPLOWO2_12_FULL_62_13b]